MNLIIGHGCGNRLGQIKRQKKIGHKRNAWKLEAIKHNKLCINYYRFEIISVHVPKEKPEKSISVYTSYGNFAMIAEGILKTMKIERAVVSKELDLLPIDEQRGLDEHYLRGG